MHLPFLGFVVCAFRIPQPSFTEHRFLISGLVFSPRPSHPIRVHSRPFAVAVGRNLGAHRIKGYDLAEFTDAFSHALRRRRSQTEERPTLPSPIGWERGWGEGIGLRCRFASVSCFRASSGILVAFLPRSASRSWILRSPWSRQCRACRAVARGAGGNQNCTVSALTASSTKPLSL